MSEPLTISTERVDDIPLLLAQMKQMDLPDLITSSFPIHGNWQGLEAGWTAVIWLTHVLSRADHRLSAVQAWAAAHLVTLQRASGQPVRPLDLTDDRLAALLRYFSDDAYWPGFEAALNRRLLRVYDLPARRVRLDSTTASGYWQVDEAGLFQFGHSKDHRPDLPQIKVMLATLDPLPLPLVTQVLPGQSADDPLYAPAIREVRRSLGRGGLLYVGDAKMAALATRGLLVAGQDYYLCPLPAVQLPPDWESEYLAGVLDGTQALSSVTRQRADGMLSPIAVGYERPVELNTGCDGWPYTWTERRLVVRSLSAAKSAEQGLRQRLATAQAELRALGERRRGKRRWPDLAAVQQASAGIVARYGVAPWVRVEVQGSWTERPVRAYNGQPARIEQTWDFAIRMQVDEEALTAAIAGLGWRVYATNQPAAELSLEQAVLAYREEYLIEQSFGRLKGAPLSLRPCYLQRDDHVTGLVRLLGLGVRVLSLLEFVVRRQLQAAGAELGGLYAGQPQARTTHPTAERLLGSFGGLTLTIITQGEQVLYHLPPLSALQSRIVELLGFAPDIYRKLTVGFAQPP